MSIFISTLAFEDDEIVNFSQIAVLLASLTAALLGGSWFVLMVPNSPPATESETAD
jgi:Na+/H+ antiporter NhaA